MEKSLKRKIGILAVMVLSKHRRVYGVSKHSIVHSRDEYAEAVIREIETGSDAHYNTFCSDFSRGEIHSIQATVNMIKDKYGMTEDGISKAIRRLNVNA